MLKRPSEYRGRGSLRAFTLFLTTVTAASAVVAQEFEEPPVLAAADILPAEAVKGEHHQVASRVVNDGMANTYLIESEFGSWKAYGEIQLNLRLREVQALADLAEVSKSKVFMDSMARSASHQAKAIAQVARNPVETAKGLPGGAKRAFRSLKRDVDEGTEKAKEVAHDDEGEDEGAEGGEGPSTTEKATGAAKKYMGFGKAERQWAQKLGVDPYSTNEVLIAEIKDVAQVDAMAGFGMKFAPIPRIPGAHYVGKARDMVYNMDPRELQEINEARLAEIGSTPEEIAAYFENQPLTPTLDTLLLSALFALEGVADRDIIIEQAALAESEPEALFFTRAVMFASWFHANESPLVRFVGGTGVPVAETKDGRLIAFSIADYLVWTAEIAGLAKEFAGSYSDHDGKKELWMIGDSTSGFAAGAEVLGWVVQANVAADLLAAFSSAETE